MHILWLRTFFASGSLASVFACASLLCSLVCRFAFFCFCAISSRLILFLIDDGSKRLVGMSRSSKEAEAVSESSVHSLSEA